MPFAADELNFSENGCDGKIEFLGNFGGREPFEEFCGDLALGGVGESFKELFVKLPKEIAGICAGGGEVIERGTLEAVAGSEVGFGDDPGHAAFLSVEFAALVGGAIPESCMQHAPDFMATAERWKSVV